MVRPRRSPAADERLRDPERSRAALLDAAEAEFGDKGLAGARVEAIAARAGVNKQLISYYFDGKQGLYDAILERWWARERSFDGPEVSLVDLVLRYLEDSCANPAMTRMFLRESIDGDPTVVAAEPDADDLQGIRHRQAAGEIGDDLDPAFVLLFLQGLVVARALFPAEAKRLTGLEPTSEEFRGRLREQLTRLVERLA